MQKATFLRTILSQYLVYIGLFVGTGFLSGSIVHFPLNPTRSVIIGILGGLIFVTSSTINEMLVNEKSVKEAGLARIILFSIVLSIGIGMISGGVQHFDEFPMYASRLIPLGLLVSLIAYLAKNNIQLHVSQMFRLSAVAVLTIAPLSLGLTTFAKSLTAEGSVEHGHGAADVVENEDNRTTENDDLGLR